MEAARRYTVTSLKLIVVSVEFSCRRHLTPRTNLVRVSAETML